MRILSFLFSLLAFSGATKLIAQVPPPTAQDTLKVVEILNAERYGFKKIDSVTELQVMTGKVKLKQDNTIFYCDSAIYNRNSKMVEAFGNIHINDADSIHTYSQYLLYYVETKMATLKKKVKLTDGKTTLHTEELYYDVNQKKGDYVNGGKVENGSSVLTSKRGTYYGDIKDVFFRDKVELRDPKYILKSDSLLYNTQTEIATFIDKTFIEDSAHRKIHTTEGYYDLKNKKAFFGRRSQIEDGAVFITADEMNTNDSTGINILKGNAVYKDTAQGVSVLANSIEANRKEGNFLATQHPLMIIKQDQDSIYITADTLFSGRLDKPGPIKDSAQQTDTINKTMVVDADSASNDSTNRYFKAYRHVRIYSDSMQAVADSMYYSGLDSIFQLFYEPILWSRDNQVTGDTMYLYTKNKKADRLFVFENGLLVNKSGENMYNQIRGNRLNAFFSEGVIEYMRARGSAESVYYILDEDSSLVGVNRASGDIIDMRFKEKELNKVVFVNDVKGAMYPISQLPESERLLPNFQWHDAKRPKTKSELFGN